MNTLYQITDPQGRKVDRVEINIGMPQAPDGYAVALDDGTPIWIPVPAAVTPLQARKALRLAGIMPSVQLYLATAPAEVTEAWEYANEIERTNTIITQVAGQLGLTDEQVDDLFRAANTL